MKNNMETCPMITLFSCQFGSFWVDLQSKLNLDLKDDINLNKRSHFKWISVCVLVGFYLYYSIRQ